MTSPEGIDNLVATGVPRERIFFVGNPMIDTLLANLDRFDVARMRASLSLPERYAVATMHRPANVDEPEQAAPDRGDAPRRQRARDARRAAPSARPSDAWRRPGSWPAIGCGSCDPLGYVDFLSLVRGAALVVTDSGGIQEETTVLGVPCLTVRPNTERPITITHGTNRLLEPEAVVPAARSVLGEGLQVPAEGPPLWDGHAGERIAEIVEAWLADRA